MGDQLQNVEKLRDLIINPHMKGKKLYRYRSIQFSPYWKSIHTFNFFHDKNDANNEIKWPINLIRSQELLTWIVERKNYLSWIRIYEQTYIVLFIVHWWWWRWSGIASCKNKIRQYGWERNWSVHESCRIWSPSTQINK